MPWRATRTTAGPGSRRPGEVAAVCCGAARHGQCFTCAHRRPLTQCGRPFGCRARAQVSHGESLGTYQRPLHVFKYMHLHEYMKGKSQSYGAAGVLGAGATVRDAKRTLHIGSGPSDQDPELKPSTDRVRAPLSQSCCVWCTLRRPRSPILCLWVFVLGRAWVEQTKRWSMTVLLPNSAGAQEAAPSEQPQLKWTPEGPGVRLALGSARFTLPTWQRHDSCGGLRADGICLRAHEPCFYFDTLQGPHAHRGW
jgi:hypothetical protein